MFMMFLVVGRYQFLSLLSIGNSYKVYAHYIEWVPGILGIAAVWSISAGEFGSKQHVSWVRQKPRDDPAHFV